jgi:CMP-N-acetylneuraminic acid synthetase
MKTIAIVPIKLNNERFPGKNTKLLGGKPLVLYCLETLLSVAEIGNTYIYCSNEEIIPLLPSGVTFLKRSPMLDLPTSNFTQIFTSFMHEVEADIYVYAHATSPFVSVETIRREINAVSSGKYDSAFCARRIQDFLWKNGKAINFDPQNVPRSQDLPIVYRETSGVYVFTKVVFETQRRRIGTNPFIAEIERREAVDINTEEDFRFAETMLNYYERR